MAQLTQRPATSRSSSDPRGAEKASARWRNWYGKFLIDEIACPSDPFNVVAPEQAMRPNQDGQNQYCGNHQVAATTANQGGEIARCNAFKKAQQQDGQNGAARSEEHTSELQSQSN